MKKFFLMLAAGLIATGASAQKLVYEKDYATSDWNFYVMGYTPEVIDGVLTSNNPMEGEDGGPNWYQYFIGDGIQTKIGESYTAVLTCKASEAVAINMNMGWGWGDGEQKSGTVKFSTEWEEVEVVYKEIGGTSSNLVLQPGMSTATIEIKNVKVYQNPPAAQYETEDVETINYAALDAYPYEEFDALPVIENGALVFPAEGEMFSAMEGVPFEVETLYGIKTKIRGSQNGTVQVSMGDWGAVAVASLDVTTDWTEVELPVGMIPNDEDGNPVTEGFVLITTKDEDSSIYYDGVLEMEYCTVAVFTEIPPVVIPTEWVSIIQNGNANDGESYNLIDRDPSIDEGGLNEMVNDWYAYICDNPAGDGKVYYCPIVANPQPGFNNSTEADQIEKWGEFQGVYDWSSQFFILFDEALEAETNLKVSFDYYCSDERNIATQAHGYPGQYHHWECIGTLAAKPEWQHKEWEGEVGSNWVGADGFLSIAFNLSNMDAAATFYINNVVVEVEKEIAEGKVEKVNAVIVPAKGVYNFQGIKVANSIEEVTAPGMYIANGKKVVIK